MLVLIWKKMLPLKNTVQRILASLCNPIAFAEGGAADRKDILFLEKLPVFNADGTVK